MLLLGKLLCSFMVTRGIVIPLHPKVVAVMSTFYIVRANKNIRGKSLKLNYQTYWMEWISQLGRSPMDRALASHHESRGSNPGANKCHAQVCWTICPEPNYARRMVHPLVAPPAQGAGYQKKPRFMKVQLEVLTLKEAVFKDTWDIFKLKTATLHQP